MSDQRPRPSGHAIALLVLAHVFLLSVLLLIACANPFDPFPQLRTGVQVALVALTVSEIVLLGLWMVLGTGMLWAKLAVLLAGGALFVLSGLLAAFGGPVSDVGVVFCCFGILIAMPALVLRSLGFAIRPTEEAPPGPLRWSIRGWLVLTAVLAAALTLSAALPAEANGFLYFLLLAVASVWAPLVSRHPVIYSAALLPGAAGVGALAAWLYSPPALRGAVVVPLCFFPFLGSWLVVRLAGYKLRTEKRHSWKDKYREAEEPRF